jgi:hypothetical protein
MVGFCRYLILPLVFALGASTVTAQIQRPSDTIDVEFSVYSFKRIRGLHYRNPAGAMEAVSFHSSSRSRSHRYRGVNPLVFYTSVPDPSPLNPDAVRHVPVAQVAVPPAIRKALLVFFAGESTEGQPEQYRIYPFDDSRANLAVGEIVFFNVSGFTLEGFIGGQRVSLRQGPSSPFRVSGRAVRVTLGVYAGSKYRQSYDNPIFLESDQRGIAFFFPPFLEGSPEVQPRILIEDLTPQAAAAQSGGTGGGP